MINQKYYDDIKKFPEQFKAGFDSTKALKVNGEFQRVVICGMGGSSLYTELVNDYLATFSKFRLEVNRGYDLSKRDDENTLFIVASYSGNTEEVLSIHDQILQKEYSHIIFTAGGKLLERAIAQNISHFQIPSGLQPRLSTGYFISALLSVLANQGLIDDKSGEVIDIVEKIDASLDEQYAKTLAEKINGKAPIVYATDNNSSIARITKIKFNENSKTQSFWYFFPELNHNEMIGFRDLVIDPFFLIFQSKYTHVRNIKRIKTFVRIMDGKNVDSEIVDMRGDSVLAEILNAYYLADHITYYLAELKGIDPEPVDMVEEFKKLLSE